MGRGAGPTRRVRTLAYCRGESLGQPASLMAWALLWKPLKPLRTTRRLSTWANTSSLLRPAFCSKPAYDGTISWLVRDKMLSRSLMISVRMAVAFRCFSSSGYLGVVLQVLGYELQAVLAAGHLVRFMRDAQPRRFTVPAGGHLPFARLADVFSR